MLRFPSFLGCVSPLVIYIHSNRPLDLYIVVLGNLSCSFLLKRRKLKRRLQN